MLFANDMHELSEQRAARSNTRRDNTKCVDDGITFRDTASMSALESAIAAAGGQTKLADMIGVRQSAVSNWMARGAIPEDQCAAIERATGIRCEDLRPDVTWVRDAAGRVTGYTVPVRAA